MAAVCKAEKLTPKKFADGCRNPQGIASVTYRLEPGDLFVLSYYGHGSQRPDVSGDQPNLRDETWCLYDAHLTDDELYLALAAFKAGTRMLVLSDSCHSGTVGRQVSSDAPVLSAGPVSRLMPAGIASRTYFANKDFYDSLQIKIRDSGSAVVEPGNVAEAVTQRAARGARALNRCRRRGFDLRLPRQPGVAGRAIHRALAGRVELRRLQGRAVQLSKADSGGPAAQAVAQPVHAGQCRGHLLQRLVAI